MMCAGCSGPQSALDAHGAQAIGLLRLMVFIIVVCTLVWALVGIALLLALKRRRDSRPDPLAIDPQIQRRMALVVASSVAATVVIITLFTVVSYVTTRVMAASEGNPVEIRVTGHQWWWEVAYLDGDARQTFITANEIHVPVGRPVRVHLVAADVIHSFWIPSLAGKQDLIPGRNNDITFTALRAGIYRGQCAEFCGFQHARMAVLVVAQAADTFEAWRRAQQQPALTPTDDDQRRGQEVFNKSCASCHTVRGTAATGTLGPDLTHVATRRTIAAGTLETTRGALAAWISDPQTIKPGNNMPMMPLDADALNAVSAYMASLK
jgi:cytochrome c oxidase subunit 2